MRRIFRAHRSESVLSLGRLFFTEDLKSETYHVSISVNPSSRAKYILPRFHALYGRAFAILHKSSQA